MEFAIEKLQTPKPHWFFREEKGFTSESAIGPGQSQVSQFGEYIEEKKTLVESRHDMKEKKYWK